MQEFIKLFHSPDAIQKRRDMQRIKEVALIYDLGNAWFGIKALGVFTLTFGLTRVVSD